MTELHQIQSWITMFCVVYLFIVDFGTRMKK